MAIRRDPVAALETLVEMRRGRSLPLTPRLARLYGGLRMPLPRAKPYVFSNFVASLDGVVSLNQKGHASGADISGFSRQDRMVMGLLRAAADAIVIGSGTLAADRHHVWTAEAVFPELAADYSRLAEALGKTAPPLNVVVSGSGRIDLRLPILSSGKVRALIVTTAAGATRLRRQALPDGLEIRAVHGNASGIAASAIVAEVCRVSSARRILVEGGPRLVGDFYAERLVDEQFLTLAPQFAGREAGDRRLSLVMGHLFPAGDARWGELVDVRRGGSLLFLRYGFPAVSSQKPNRRR